MTEQQTMLAVGAGVLVAFVLFKRWRMGGNKVKLKEMMNSGAKVIDVRSRSEFASGHFAGAVNIPLDELASRMASIGKKEDPVIVYCASGMRSGSAKSALKAAGFVDVENGINHANLQSLK